MIQSNKLWWGVFSLLAIATFFFMYFRINQGLTFTNLNNIVGWGLWVTFYVYFLGISVGLFLFYGVCNIFNIAKFRNLALIALYSSFITLIVGLFFIFIDIGHLGRFWTVFINRNVSSVLSWELHLYVIYMVTVALLLVFENLGIEKKYSNTESIISTWCNENKEKVIKYLTYLGIPLAIAVHGGTGALFAVIKARVFWNSAIFPVIFLISALLSGIAAIIFLLGCFHNVNLKTQYIKKLSNIFIIVIVLDVFVVMTQLFVHYYSDINESIAVIHLLFYGEYAKSFWIGQIGIGIILTLILFAIYRMNTKGRFWILWLSSISCLIGIWFIRMNFITPTLSVPLIEGLSENIYGIESTNYVPSLMEWIYSLFIIISGFIVYLFGVSHIPILKNIIHQKTKKGDFDEETA
ncbi:hypothetical protein BKP35_08565 [Anaerobacillus arseniciselenatis]|uniref:Molybdopterin oxidoreductase n=1 Tax=Anaerobacillus arseniciselenatis TaxID=85682 RepID=A0A1S2LMR4_9BACI|nr:NrfD/PsrC family molybdoenzyme membrane anchor subunit [Anaerobacillus arseniciselenatis]OIJ13819.1 hypothetical protein BKP35_08565 [Anaerobacillus arseniciselenatis]